MWEENHKLFLILLEKKKKISPKLNQRVKCQKELI